MKESSASRTEEKNVRARAGLMDYAMDLQDDETSMHFAARSGNATEIKKLISSGADVNARNSVRNTRLTD